MVLGNKEIISNIILMTLLEIEHKIQTNFTFTTVPTLHENKETDKFY